MKKHILKIIKEYDRSERAAMMDRKRIFRDLSGNYPEFYSNFENIFLNSYDLFKKAIIELKDISDPIYVEMLSDFEKTSAVVEVFVIRYILRLSFCFNIDVENNPLIIRKIIESVNGTEKREMVWGEAIELMASVCGESKGESPQLYYGDYGATADNRILDNVITLDDVTDVDSAKDFCYAYEMKAVRECPRYIKDIYDFAYLMDQLVGDGGESYFSTGASSKLKRAMTLTKRMGFDDLSDLLSEVYDRIITERKKFPIKIGAEIASYARMDLGDQLNRYLRQGNGNM